MMWQVPGNGIVDAYDLQGNFLRRLATNGVLNSPWGLALAPAGFGDVGGDLLVGNFGDGTINAYNPDDRRVRPNAQGSERQPDIDRRTLGTAVR